jgi:hypothetical protein
MQQPSRGSAATGNLLLDLVMNAYDRVSATLLMSSERLARAGDRVYSTYDG